MRLTKKLMAIMLSIAMVLSVCIIPAAAQNDEGLLIFYNFADGAEDASGNGNDGTLSNVTITDDEIFGKAGEFNGSSRVVMPVEPFTALNDYSFEAWINPSTLETWTTLWSLASDQKNYMNYTITSNASGVKGGVSYSIEINDSENRISAKNGVSPTVNTWNHIAFTQEGNIGRLYLNGQLVAESNNDISLHKAELVNKMATLASLDGTNAYLGTGTVWGDPGFKGRIAEFKVYNKTLSSDDIAAEYASIQDQIQLVADKEAVADAKDKLTITDFTNQDINLPGEIGENVSISWESNNTDIITNDGKVTRPVGADTEVTLIATLTKGNASDTKEFIVTVQRAAVTDQDIVALDKQALDLGDISKIRGDIELPALGYEGSTITWVSSRPDVISAYGIYTEIEDQAEDITVILTATITKGSVSDTKEFTAVVPAFSNEPYAYLMAHFPNVSPFPTSFSVSLDGQTFTKINPSEPQLESTVGNGMTRDPFIFRGQDGVFHIIATDGWTSRDIFVADSTDLVNWTNHRILNVNGDLAERGVDLGGHAWAPECSYDPEVGKYLIYWSASTNESLDPDGPGQKGQGQYHKTYAVYTEDFVTFEKPFILIDPGFDIIDPTMVQYEGRWYTVLKDERNNSSSVPTGKKLIWGEADHLSGPWTIHTELAISEDSRNKEGPTIYKDIHSDGYFLAWDYFSNSAMGVAYSKTPNIGTSWKIVDSDIANDVRHPSVITITEEEYYRVLDAFGADSGEIEIPDTIEEPKAEPILHYSFEKDTIEGNIVKDISGNGNDGTLYGSPSFEEDPLNPDGQSIRLNNDNITSQSGNGQYVSMPSQLLANINDVTISGWIYCIAGSATGNTNQGRFFDFGTGPSSSGKYYFYYSTQYDSSSPRVGITMNSNAGETTVMAPNRDVGNWHHIAVVLDGTDMILYYDGVEYRRNSNLATKPFMLEYTAAFLGRSMWGPDKLYNGRIDDFRVYNRAVSAEEISNIYQGKTDDELAKLNTDLALLDLGDLSAVTDDISLPTTLKYGSTIEWLSDKPEYIDNTGKVTRPAYETGKVPVTLTAVVTNGDSSQTITFNAIVLPRDKMVEGINIEAPEKAGQNNLFEIKVTTTSFDVDDIRVTSEYGLDIGRQIIDTQINMDNTVTWTIGLSIGTKGNRELTVTTFASGQAKDKATFNIAIVNPWEVNPPEVEPEVYEAGIIENLAAVNQPFTVVIKTSLSVQDIQLYNEYGDTIGQLSKEYSDQDGVRTWTIKAAFGTKGNRTLSFKAMCDGGTILDAGSDRITIIKM